MISTQAVRNIMYEKRHVREIEIISALVECNFRIRSVRYTATTGVQTIKKEKRYWTQAKVASTKSCSSDNLLLTYQNHKWIYAVVEKLMTRIRPL